MITIIRQRVITALLLGGALVSTAPAALAGGTGICGANGCLIVGTLPLQIRAMVNTDEITYVDGHWRVGGYLLMKFGDGSAHPVLGDWDGDGYDEPGLYVDGQWYLRESWDRAHSTNVNVATVGGPTSRPVVGNWDGSAKDSVGVFDEGVFTLLADPADPASTIVIDFGYLPDNPGLAADPLPFAGPIGQDEALVGIVYHTHVMYARENVDAQYDFHAHEASGAEYGTLSGAAHPYFRPIVTDLGTNPPAGLKRYVLGFKLPPSPSLNEHDACGTNFWCFHNPDRPDDSGATVMPEPNPF